LKRRTRRTRSEQELVIKERRRPNILYLLGAALVLSVIASIFFNDHQGERLGLSGAYVAVTALAIAFALRLADLARFVLPPQSKRSRSRISQFVGENESWEEGMRMLFYHFAILSLPEPLRDRLVPRRSSVPPPLPQSFAEFKAGFVDSHLALGLAKGTGFSRAAGPGYVRLEQGERISEVIDLRRQVRRRTVEAMTRDGILLQTTITITFCIRQLANDNNTPREGTVPYPYDPDNIFRLSYANGAGIGTSVPWSARISPEAAALLIAEIGKYRLDQLYQPTIAEEADAVPFTRVAENVEEKLVDKLPQIFDCNSPDECPVIIEDVSIVQFRPPKEIVEQRVNNWQGAWEQHINQQKKEAKVSLEQARAIAVKELVETVTRDLSTQDRGQLSTMILSNVSKLMEELNDNGPPPPPEINIRQRNRRNGEHEEGEA
jgi:hypothetical protein